MQNMQNMQNRNLTGEYLILLVRAALQNEKPEEKPEDVYWEEVLRMAYQQKVSNLSYQSVKRVEVKPKEEILKKWKLFAQKAELTEILYEAELNAILADMEEAQIKYVCLKGIVMRKLYPAQGMREMSDQDILYDTEKRDALLAIMKKHGYEFEPESELSFHDRFHKEPNLAFEMHKQLFDVTLKENEYYWNIWERVAKNNTGNYGYHMFSEDFFVFQILHLKKHYERSGAGIKMLADIYVLYRQMEKTVRWNYIDRELKKLNAAAFAKERFLDALWMFGTDKEQKFAEAERDSKALRDDMVYLIRSGPYGIDEIGYENKIRRNGGKSKYLFRRVFMSYDEMRGGIPFVEGRPWLCPFVNLYRIFVKTALNGKRILREVRVLNRME